MKYCPERDYCFDAGRGTYWIKNQGETWIMLNETQFKRELRQGDVSPIVPNNSYVSPLDEVLLGIQHNFDVHYAGALAGHTAGIRKMGERRILVTESPRIIKPERGKWPTLHAVINGLLGGAADKRFGQANYLYGWLKIAYEALCSGEPRPGQALVLAGVHGIGKSLLQNIITRILGGRSARPYQFMTGLTPFNSDLFEAEHLAIEDDQPSTDIRARRNFGAQLKNITANDWQRCHTKYRVPISLRPFWRLSISLNEEPENLMVLPPIDDSIEDKLILLRAAQFPMPMPTATLAQRKAFWNTLEGELPAFIQFLVQWEIPQELVSERFGIAHFHHPDILEAIDDLAPESKLLSLIKHHLESLGDTSWGPETAEKLERELNGSDSQYEAKKLFSFNNACGVYLGRLAKKYPKAFIHDRTEKERLWTINWP
jgi:uncharacterized protein DUF5906